MYKKKVTNFFDLAAHAAKPFPFWEKKISMSKWFSHIRIFLASFSSNQTFTMRGLTSISFLLYFVYLAHGANFYKNTKLALKECVPLPQCKALNWLWRNRESIPTISQDNIEEFIFSLNCGLDICPKEKKVQNRLDRNPLIKGLKRNPVRKSSFAENVSYNCKAHLRYVGHNIEKKDSSAMQILREINFTQIIEWIL